MRKETNIGSKKEATLSKNDLLDLIDKNHYLSLIQSYSKMSERNNDIQLEMKENIEALDE